MLDFFFLQFLEKQPSQMRFQAMERLRNRFKMKILGIGYQYNNILACFLLAVRDLFATNDALSHALIVCTSNFSFSHNVFHSYISLVHQMLHYVVMG